MPPVSILDACVKSAPSQHALNILEGEWAFFIPPPHHLRAGKTSPFNDECALWAPEQLGGCQDQKVLKLGPLKGGHSYSERSGAASIISVEANTRAYFAELRAVMHEPLLFIPQGKTLLVVFCRARRDQRR